MISWFQNTASHFNLTADEFLFVCIALFFLLSGAVLIGLLFVSRVIKTDYEKRRDRIKVQYQKILNTIIIHETFSASGQPQSAFEYRMGELRAIMGTTTFNKQVLIDQIIDIQKSLSGNSAKALIQTYRELELYKVSIDKLLSFAWKRKAQGVRELAEMSHKESLPLILQYLNARNLTLREESFIALVRLSEEDPLFFLDDFTNELTLWMRINIHRFLARIDARQLPAFSRWFNHSNTSVVLFSLSMAREFRQASCIPDVVKLLYRDDRRVAGLAIEALGDLEAYEHAQCLVDLVPRVWSDEKQSRRLVRSMGKIGNADQHRELLLKFLEHPAYEVRFEAAQSLKKFGSTGKAALLAFGANEPDSVGKIIRHMEEPLLN